MGYRCEGDDGVRVFVSACRARLRVDSQGGGRCCLWMEVRGRGFRSERGVRMMLGCEEAQDGNGTGSGHVCLAPRFCSLLWLKRDAGRSISPRLDRPEARRRFGSHVSCESHLEGGSSGD